jgi:hypothetical protein
MKQYARIGAVQSVFDKIAKKKERWAAGPCCFSLVPHVWRKVFLKIAEMRIRAAVTLVGSAFTCPNAAWDTLGTRPGQLGTANLS